MHTRSFGIKLSLVILGFLITFGCGSSRSIWDAESRSPDGKVTATARTIVTNQGLFIISGTYTEVDLHWAATSRNAVSILELADATEDSADTHVEMNWLTPTHLELTIRGNQSITFQAVKWNGIDISVQDFSKAAIERENPTKTLAPPPPPTAYDKTNSQRYGH